MLGLPIAYDVLIRRQLYKDFFFWSAISGVTILVPMVITDSLLYGRLIIAPYNIVKYNVFGGAGPNLYGTEPFSYYLINGFLNFNLVWVSAAMLFSFGSPHIAFMFFWKKVWYLSSLCNLEHISVRE